MIESTVSDTQKWYGLVAKRLMDLIFAAALLLLLWPLFFVIAFGIRISSPGPIVFVQMRMGRGLEPFALYKFRTMRIDTPHDRPTHLLENPGQYITKVGGFLRKTGKLFFKGRIEAFAVDQRNERQAEGIGFFDEVCRLLHS